MSCEIKVLKGGVTIFHRRLPNESIANKFMDKLGVLSYPSTYTYQLWVEGDGSKWQKKREVNTNILTII